MTEAAQKPDVSSKGRDKGNAGEIQKAIKILEKAKGKASRTASDWEADKNAVRGKIGSIIPGFEGIIRKAALTKEGNNAELFRRILNLRV